MHWSSSSFSFLLGIILILKPLISNSADLEMQLSEAIDDENNYADDQCQSFNLDQECDEHTWLPFSYASGDCDDYADCCDCLPTNWDLWAFDNYIFVGYTGGHGLGWRRGYTSAGVFFTPSYFANSRFVPFLDVRGHIFNNGKGAANVGLGLRYIISSWNTVLGINSYYDYCNYRGDGFNQIGIGFEWLTPLCDFRLNGYFPVGSYNHRKGTLFDFGDDLFAVRFGWKQAYKGVDAELGVWVLDKTPCNWFGLYLAVGPYYYTRDHRRHTIDDTHRHIKGAQGRVLAKINDYVDLSVRGTYDNFFHGTLQGQITLNMPINDLFACFSCSASSDRCCCKPLPCLMRQIAIQPVERNDIIVTADTDCTWQWNWSGACPCSDCDGSYSCPSSYSDGYSGGYASRSWHSSDFSSHFFPYPYACSDCHSSSSGSCSCFSFSRSDWCRENIFLNR